jgi:thioredoxin-dependent peroxiredoxin
MPLPVGSPLPTFAMPLYPQGTITNKSCKGVWTVLYFYPKDATGTCTKQACSFRDSFDKITATGAILIGVSPDAMESHTKFATEQHLPFALAADNNHKVCELFDVWKEKKLYGNVYMGVVRTTYIINPKGRIAAVFENVRVKGHADAVLLTLAQLQMAT